MEIYGRIYHHYRVEKFKRKSQHLYFLKLVAIRTNIGKVNNAESIKTMLKFESSRKPLATSGPKRMAVFIIVRNVPLVRPVDSLVEKLSKNIFIETKSIAKRIW